MLRISSLLILLAISGCVTGSPEQLFGVEPIPESRPEANTTGAYPKIGHVPRGETNQLTDSQAAATKAELDAAASRGRAQQARTSAARNRQEAARLQASAEAERRRRLQEIQKADQE